MSRSSAAQGATPLVRAFSRELARVGGLLAPEFLSSGMSLGEARCLYELGHGDGLELSGLAERLDLDLGYVSRAVSLLVRRRLVTKRVAASDARARTIVVTRKGQAMIAELDAHTNQRLGDWLAGKPRAAVDDLVAGLGAMYGDGAAATRRGRNGGETTVAAGDHDDGATITPVPTALASAATIAIRAPRPGEIGHIIARHGEFYVGERGYPAIFERYVVKVFGEFVADFAPPRDRIFVAEQEGQFVGSIASKGLPGRIAQLRFLLVEEAARGRGLGRRLVRRVIEHARRSGDRRIVLDTASDLAAARALYAAHGFRKTASVTGEVFLPRGVASERWELTL
jgi:DNA-binding MarR family transcriptional regulator/predicted GNAT family acetyltransferase